MLPPAPTALTALRPTRRGGTLGIWGVSLLLLVQGLALLSYAYVKYSLSGLVLTPDSQEYIELSRSPHVESLGSHRTIGYPLFLRGVSLLSPGLALLPAAQVVFHVAAVLAFTWFLAERCGSSLMVLFVGSTVLWSNTALEFVGAVLTDLPGQSAAILAVAALLGVTSRPRSTGRWFLFAGSLFASYQIRPVYQLLIVVSPLIAFWVAPGTPLRPALRLAGSVALAGAVPLALFAALRAAVVGHLAVTSFLGINLVGITGQLISREEAARELREPYRQIALRAIESRDAAWSRRCCPDLPVGRQALDRTGWNQRYIATVQGFGGAAHEVLGASGKTKVSAVQIDSALRTIAFETITRHPLRYYFFVFRELEFALKRLVTGQLMLLPIFIGAGLLALWRTLPFASSQDPWLDGLAIAHIAGLSKIMVPAALLFGGVKAFIVCCLEPALDRYIDAAAVFVPGAVLCVAAIALRAFAHDGGADRGTSAPSGSLE